MRTVGMWLMIVLAFCTGATAQIEERHMDTDGIVQMQNAGLSQEIIVEAIRGASSVHFDTSAQGLMAMKDAGFPDSIILAVVERQVREVSAGVSLSSQRWLVRQGGRELELAPKEIETSFVPAKKKNDTAKQIIEYGGLSAGVYAGAGLAGQLATMGALGRGALSGIAAGIVVGVGMLGRNPTVQGFNFEFVRGRSATLALAPGEAEFLIPLAPFHDGSYATAEALLLRLDISQKDDLRILSSEKLKVTGGDKPKKQSLEPKQFKFAET